ncbi:hypothetical protein F4Z98_03385 [Candidatus Poribacteria bacterium]|nr:hypothetical protein [Candidatus Poribacteria bacterium]MYA99406.1 hypothetical protein [Candidatus Poribacteria bacterium]
MSKLTLTEAVSVIPVSESTLRRDLKSGKVSFETDAKGRKQIDVSELTRVYGPLNPPPEAEPVPEIHQNPSLNGTETPRRAVEMETDTPQVRTLLENQIADLKSQLEKSEAREAQLIDEKSQLLDMLSREQQRRLPPSAEDSPVEAPPQPSLLSRLFGRLR